MLRPLHLATASSSRGFLASARLKIAAASTRRYLATTSARSQQHTPPLPSPAPHVLIYGGGAMGLLHASLMQLRLNHDRQSSSPQHASAATAPCNSSDSGSVRVVSSQRSLVELLCNEGLEVELLRSFMQANAEWMPINTQKQIEAEAEKGSSHVKLSPPIRLHASCSALTSPLRPTLQPYSHILVCTKGAQAFEHACRELVHIFRWQMRSSADTATHPTAVVCLMMNGMGHKERMMERLDAILREANDNTDGNGVAISSESDRRAFLDRFQQRLILATTTSGARLHKEFGASPTDDSLPPLVALRLRHGGSGSTIVMQNEFEAQAGPAASSPSASHSLLDLFRSIGLSCTLAPPSLSSTMLHTKLLINCVINPLTGVHGVRNGELLEERFRTLVLHITAETLRVMRAMHVAVAEPTEQQLNDAAPEVKQAMQATLSLAASIDSMRDDVAHSLGALRAGLFHVYTTCHHTRHNYSSMYTDLHPSTTAPQASGRSMQTEIEFITGYLLRQADEKHVPADQVRHTRALYEAVKAAERRNERS